MVLQLEYQLEDNQACGLNKASTVQVDIRAVWSVGNSSVKTLGFHRTATMYILLAEGPIS
jgi:hypothetical protein